MDSTDLWQIATALALGFWAGSLTAIALQRLALARMLLHLYILAGVAAWAGWLADRFL